MRAGGVMLLAGVIVAGCGGGASEPEGPPFQATGTVRELMASMIDPAADLVWDAVGTVVSEEGVDHWEPSTEEEWARVRQGAMTIAESGNLLMMDERARDTEAWMRLSLGMVEAGRRALAAVDARDAEQVFALGEQLYDSCDACHMIYWVGDGERGRVD